MKEKQLRKQVKGVLQQKEVTRVQTELQLAKSLFPSANRDRKHDNHGKRTFLASENERSLESKLCQISLLLTIIQCGVKDIRTNQHMKALSLVF